MMWYSERNFIKERFQEFQLDSSPYVTGGNSRGEGRMVDNGFNPEVQIRNWLRCRKRGMYLFLSHHIIENKEMKIDPGGESCQHQNAAL